MGSVSFGVESGRLSWPRSSYQPAALCPLQTFVGANMFGGSLSGGSRDGTIEGQGCNYHRWYKWEAKKGNLRDQDRPEWASVRFSMSA